MTAMRFIGLDLAWSMRKTQRPDTGAVVLDESGQVLANAHLTTDVEILAYVLAHSGADGGIVGIDAPLVVPNDTGRRACEAQLHAVGISSYPANRSNFARAYGGVRGELLMMRLSAEGFALATEMAPGMPRRACLEVYPRAFIQRTWGAVPPYKGAGPPTTLLYGLRALQQHLLTDLDPPVRWHEPPVPLDGWPHLARRELKCWGDLLDAALSAYTVYLAWRRGPLAMEVFGDLERGFIVAPRAGWRASVAASTATLPFSVGDGKPSQVSAQSREPRKAPRECRCGCGGMTKGGRFLPGHDAKLKSVLLQRIATGDRAALEELEELGWGRLLRG